MNQQQLSSATQRNRSIARPLHSVLRPILMGVALTLSAAMTLAATTYTMTQAVQRDPVTNAIVASITIPRGINKFGQIAGRCGVYNPADNTITTMFTISASGQRTCNISTYGLNADRQTVGLGFAIIPGLSVRNIDGSVISLGTAPGLFGGWSTAISDTGFVAGYNGTGSGGWCDHRAVLGNLSTGVVQALGTLKPGYWSYPYGVNNSGQVVGHAAYSSVCVIYQYGGAHAFVSTPTGLKDLHVATGTPNAGANTSSIAYAISDTGIAVGNYMFSQGATSGTEIYHATAWNTVTDTFTDLGSGSVSSTLYGVNNKGQVVGQQGSAAVVGDIAGGGLTDLNTLVPGKPAGVFFTKAMGINDSGQIVVEAGDTTAYLLTPTGIVATPTVAPSNVIATVVTNANITLSWTDNANNETAQYVQRCYQYNNACSAKVQVLANATSYTDTGFVSGYAYYYRVSAVSTSGESTAATSNLANTGPPTMVTAMRVTGLARTQATIEWNDNAFDETSYAVDRIVCSTTTSICASKNKVNLPANTTRYTVTGLKANTEYTYRVWAVGRFGISGISEVTFRTLP